MTLIQLIGIVAALGTGAAVLRANPTRSINRAFFILSVGVVIWLATLAAISPDRPNILFWIRLANAEAALLPWLFWILKQTVYNETLGLRSLVSGWLWGVISLALVALCFTNYFIPANSIPEHILVGPGRSIFNTAIAAEYLWLLMQTLRELRSVQGIRRVELQFLMINGAGAGLAAVLMNAVSVWLRLPELRRMEPLVIVGFYVTTAWGITSGKVFDARQLFRSAIIKLLYVSIAASIIGSLGILGDEWSRYVTAIVSAVVVVFSLDWVKRLVDATTGDSKISGIRRRLLETSRETLEWDGLAEKFSAILISWGRCEHAYVLAVGGDSEDGNRLPGLSEAAAAELNARGWATPEQIQRQVSLPQSSALGSYMQTHRLGLVVAGPGGPESMAMTVALGVRTDRSPYTWTDVQLAREWAAIIEGSLSRVMLTRQARDAEQLATIGLLGASLAHEIRNPLVTIKSVLSTPTQRRSEPQFQHLMFEVMPGEVERIELMVTGLMDLGKPMHLDFGAVSLHDVIQGMVKMVMPKAKQNTVTILQELEAEVDTVHADASSLRRLILNLLMNAIDAVAGHTPGGKVIVRTRSTMAAMVLEIADNGPGVPLDVKRTLFRPFTRSSKTSGMGLGLSICADIVRSHHGEIVLVDSAPVGSTFRISLPWQPPSS